MRAWCLILTLFLSAPVIAARAAYPVPESYQELDNYVEERVDRNRDVIGAAIAVVDHGDVVFMKPYGVKRKGGTDKIDLDTVFQLGSISKPITASLFALAEKKHLLTLDSPVKLRKEPGASEVRIRHLLSHTSGIKRKGWNWKIEAGWSRQQLLDELSTCESEALGERFDYHNVAFSLIEEALGDAFKMPFDDALETNLLQPLGMKRTTVGFADFVTQPNRAWPHERQRRRRRVMNWRPCKRYSNAYHKSVVSAGGINSSIRDMAKFLQFQMGGFPNVAQKEDLASLYVSAVQAPDARAWFRHLETVDRSDLKSFYGYGWRILEVEGERLVYHGGWLHGFMNFMAFSPKDQLGIIVLNNSESDLGLSTAIRFFKEARKPGKTALRL